MSDGDVERKYECIKQAENHRGDTRIFSLGISQDCDRELITEISRSSGGDCRFVTTDIADNVIPLLKSARTNALTSLQFHFSTENGDEIPIEVVPYPYPILFSGTPQHLLVHSQISVDSENSKEFDQNTSILVVGKFNEEEVEIPVTIIEKGPETALKALYAQQAIRDFTREIEKVSDESEKQKYIEKIVQLSLSSGVLSKYTVLVGISSAQNYYEPMDDLCYNTTACSPSYDVGVCYACPPSYESHKYHASLSSNECYACPPSYSSKKKSSNCAGGGSSSKRGHHASAKRAEVCEERMAAPPPELDQMPMEERMEEIIVDRKPEPIPPPKKVSNFNLGEFISLQDFDGYWGDRDAVLKYANGKDVKVNVPDEVNNDQKDKIEITLIALTILNLFASDRKAAWILVEEKAFRWLNSVLNKNWQEIIDEAVANLN